MLTPTNTIVNCYAPNSVATEEDKDNSYSELEAAAGKEMSYYKYICVDFKSLVGNGSDGNWRLRRHGNEARNENDFRLLDLMFSCNQFHGNSVFQKPQHSSEPGKVLKDKLIRSWTTSSQTKDIV
ncbi:hypothetical protein ANCDUO_11386 [Ancylostoma duodenale]|uniref:Uncharacterized protein n=1 Tax=Ancylostoma duodenale TaxID=51022 RepID=A0A0C2GN60_9BILA|nr:hypothetical protein ANCDUO_11386 [Ancylostoma duodenale]